MNKINYQLELDKIIKSITAEGRVPTLLLHSCCAPCSSYCLSYLAEYFSITVLYYNPNISPEAEYKKRVQEQIRLIGELPVKNKVFFAEGFYEPQRFYEMAQGMEGLPEGGARCFSCYEMRQRAAAEYAKEHGFDYFTTTLSVSPHKNAGKLNTADTQWRRGFRLQRNIRFPIWSQILRKGAGIRNRLNIQKNIIYTDKIIADVNLAEGWSENG